MSSEISTQYQIKDEQHLRYLLVQELIRSGYASNTVIDTADKMADFVLNGKSKDA